ncbi:MAG: cytochrome P460 family protein [Hyphomicrobiaceae bacterium]|nr:cytochrome P460 family protein [Hyphomicrobiaceae bacterium]
MARSIVAALASLAGAAAVAEEARITFPQNYATEFKNYLSLDRVQNADQIIRLFANSAASEAGAAGKELPDGSVLVGEVYAAQKDGDGKVIVSDLGRRVRSKLVAIAVMEKRQGWGEKYPTQLRNGDWDFAIFSPAGKRLDKDLDACRSCHAPLATRQHVFSLEHIGK